MSRYALPQRPDWSVFSVSHGNVIYHAGDTVPPTVSVSATLGNLAAGTATIRLIAWAGAESWNSEPVGASTSAHAEGTLTQLAYLLA